MPYGFLTPAPSPWVELSQFNHGALDPTADRIAVISFPSCLGILNLQTYCSSLVALTSLLPKHSGKIDLPSKRSPYLPSHLCLRGVSSSKRPWGGPYSLSMLSTASMQRFTTYQMQLDRILLNQITSHPEVVTKIKEIRYKGSGGQFIGCIQERVRYSS